MRIRLRQILLAATAVIAIAAPAQDAFAQAFSIQGFANAGTGCPAGVGATVAVGTAPLGVTLSFPRFVDEGRDDGVRRRAATCNLAVRLQPDPGVQLALTSIEVRGRLDVMGAPNVPRARSNTARLTREYFFNDTTGDGYRFPILDLVFVNSLSSYSVEDRRPGPVAYSRCDLQSPPALLLRSRLQLLASDIRPDGPNAAAIETVTFHLQEVRCSIPTDRGPVIIGDPDPGPPPPPTIRNACVLENSGRQRCFDAAGNPI